MTIRLQNNNLPVGSSAPEESKPAILSNEEKEFLDLFAAMIVQDIINDTHSDEE